MSKSVQRKLSKWLTAALNDYTQCRNFTNICNGFQCKTNTWILILSGLVLRLARISKKHWKNACCLRKRWGLEWWDLSADLSHCTNNKGKLFKECQGTLCPFCACVCLAWAGNGRLLTPRRLQRDSNYRWDLEVDCRRACFAWLFTWNMINSNPMWQCNAKTVQIIKNLKKNITLIEKQNCIRLVFREYILK